MNLVTSQLISFPSGIAMLTKYTPQSLETIYLVDDYDKNTFIILYKERICSLFK